MAAWSRSERKNRNTDLLICAAESGTAAIITQEATAPGRSHPDEASRTTLSCSLGSVRALIATQFSVRLGALLDAAPEPGRVAMGAVFAPFGRAFHGCPFVFDSSTMTVSPPAKLAS